MINKKALREVCEYNINKTKENEGVSIYTVYKHDDSDILALLNENAELRETVEFYSNGDMMDDFSEVETNLGSIHTAFKVNRIGKRARACIAKIDGGE